MIWAYLSLQTAFYLGLLKLHSTRRRERLLLFGGTQPTEIPVLDSRLAAKAGQLTWKQSWKANKIIALCRKAVNTRSFEHFIRGWVNSKSELHANIVKLDKLRKKAGLGL